MHAHPFHYIYHRVKKLLCTLLLRWQIHSPYFYSTLTCILWSPVAPPAVIYFLTYFSIFLAPTMYIYYNLPPPPHTPILKIPFGLYIKKIMKNPPTQQPVIETFHVTIPVSSELASFITLDFGQANSNYYPRNLVIRADFCSF